MKKKLEILVVLMSFLISTTVTSYGYTYKDIPRMVKNETFDKKIYYTCAVKQYSKSKKSKSIEEIIEEIKQGAREETRFMKEIGEYDKSSKSEKNNRSKKSIEEIIEEIKQAAREETEFMKEIGEYKKDSKNNKSKKSIEEIIEEIRQAAREETEFMKEIGEYKENSKSEKSNKSTKSTEEIIEEIKQALREETEFMKEIGAYKEGSKKTFSDISSHWAKDYIEKLAEKNIVSGIDNNKFNPEGYMTRAQIAVILVKGLDIDINSYENSKVFEDVDVESGYSKFAYVAHKNNLINGINGEFKPEKELLGEELIQIFVNAYEKKYGAIDLDLENTNNTEDISDWAKTALAKAKKIGAIEKVLDPIEYKGKVKRGQVCALMCELIK